MKNQKLHLVALLALTAACNNHPKQKSQQGDTTAAAKVANTTLSTPAQGNPIDYSAAKVLDTVFVMQRQGAAIKEMPDDAAPAYKQAGYAEMLHTIERRGNWYGVMYYVNRQYTEAGKQISASRWEKLYVAAKDVGKANQLKLTAADLNIVSGAVINGKPQNIQKPVPLNSIIKLDLVDQQTYRARQAAAVNFFNADTNAINKVKGVISLPIKNGVKKIVDKPDAEEQREVFEYQGQIEALNTYVLMGNYYESSGYQLINTITGKVDAELAGFPHLSGSKAQVMCVSGLEYEGGNTSIQLLQVTPGGLKMVLDATFSNWFPIADKRTDAFWSDDNCFYIPVVRAEIANSGFDWHTLTPQYLRISLR